MIHVMRYKCQERYVQPKCWVADSGETSLGRPRIRRHDKPTLSAEMDGRMDTVLEEAGEKIYD